MNCKSNDVKSRRHLIVTKAPKVLKKLNLTGGGLEIPVGLTFHGCFGPGLESPSVRGYLRAGHSFPELVEVDLVSFAIREPLLQRLESAGAISRSLRESWQPLRYEGLIDAKVPDTLNQIREIASSIREYKDSREWFLALQRLDATKECDYWLVKTYLSTALPMRRWYLEGRSRGRLHVAETFWDALQEVCLDTGERFSFEMLRDLPIVACSAGLLVSDEVLSIMREHIDRSFFYSIPQPNTHCWPR